MAFSSPPGGELRLPKETGWPYILHEEAGCDLKCDNLKGILWLLFPLPSQAPGGGSGLRKVADFAGAPVSNWNSLQLTLLSAIDYFFSSSIFLSLPRPHCLWNFPQSFQPRDTRQRLLVLVSDIRLWSLPDVVLTNLILLILWGRGCCAHLPCMKLRLISAYQLNEDLNPCQLSQKPMKAAK